MCLITVGKLPEPAALRIAHENNPHGIGVAWNTRHGVQYRKNLSVKQLLALPDAIKEYCAVHFRLATVGGAQPALIHPYPVTEQVSLKATGIAPAVLMHNGHISDYETCARAIKGRALRGPVSDSRIVARLVNDYGRQILHLIRGQRFLYVSPRSTLMYGSGWTKEGETWYSNDSHKENRFAIVGASREYQSAFTYTKGERDNWKQVMRAWDEWESELDQKEKERQSSSLMLLPPCIDNEN